MIKTVGLLFCSNLFMTIAWYGHLKHRSSPLLVTILVSWMIALPEYCFQVPANRFGYGSLSAFQLKIIQEIVTLTVFVIFAWLYLDEPVRLRYLGSFACIVGAVVFAFWGKA